MTNTVDRIARRFTELGFTNYESKILAALMVIGPATAKEIAELSKVPRPKVYEILKNLANKGFIEIQYGKPMLFVPLTREALIDRIKSSYLDVIDELISDLKHLTTMKRTKPIYALTIIGENNVIFKLREIISRAKAEIKLVIVNPRLLIPIRNILKAVHKRGILIDCLIPEYDKKLVKELRDIAKVQVLDPENIPVMFRKMFERIREHEDLVMAANIDREEVFFIFKNEEVSGVWIKVRAVAEIQALIIDSIVKKVAV